MTALSEAELAALKEYENDLRDMPIEEMQRELDQSQTLIDEETSWVEALSARIHQLELEKA